MLLTLDIGNTEITAGIFRGDQLVAQWRMTTAPERTPDEWAITIGGFLEQKGHSPNEVRAACIASVAPAVTRSITEGVAASTGVAPAQVESDSKLPVALDVDEPLTVGADRIANVLAALDAGLGDAIVADFGTATTFDCITADGRFIGGVIMPGLRTSADQLTRRAAKLPATELTAPDQVIGRRTEDCIRSGVLFGTADAVDGIVGRIRAEWDSPGPVRCVATGGLAPLIAPLTRSIESVHPDLTLQGLRIAARHLGQRW